MLQPCTEEPNYFETIEFISIGFHCLTVIEVPIHIFVGYLILFKTPESMGSVKWHMFNVHFWSALLDISFSFLTAPYILFPHVAGYGAGFLMWLGVHPFAQTVIIVIEIGSTILSIAVLFENRYTILASSDQFWSRVRKFMMGVMYFVAWTYFIPLYWLAPDQTVAVPGLMEELPQLHCFYTGPVYVLASDPTLVGWSTAAKIILEFLFILVTFTLTLMSILTQNKNVNLSKKTLGLQKKFFLSITIQTVIPVAVIASPLLCCAISVLEGHYSQSMNNICFLVLANHGLVTSFVIMIIHKPYRDATFPCIANRRNNQTDFISVILPTVE